MILEGVVWWTWVVFAIVLALSVDLLFMGLFRTMRKGRFNVRVDKPDNFAVRTDFGLISINHSRNTLSVAAGSRLRSILLTDIAKVKYSNHESWAFFADYFFGLDVFDLFSPYKDRVNWHTIKLLLKDGTELPLFVAGEYEPREFLFGWYLNIQASALRSMGFLTDVAEHARESLDALLVALRRGGTHVPFP